VEVEGFPGWQAQPGDSTDDINDIMITTTSQYHFLCPVKQHRNMFIYLAVNRKSANVSLCRQMMFAVDKNLV